MEETKEIKISIPEGYEIDTKNSTFECIKFKKKVKEVNTWKDISKLQGFYILEDSTIKELDPVYHNIRAMRENTNVFINRKYAKSALALAQISQLMPYYRGEITDEEWRDVKLKKYGVIYYNNKIATNIYYDTKQIIGFHTEEQLNRFLSFPENMQLIRDLYMVD